MLLDDPLGLLTLRPSQFCCGLRLAVNKTVLGRLLLGLTPLGLFARGAQINDGAHVDSNDFQ